MLHGFRQKKVTRREIEGAQNLEIFDAVVANDFDQLPALTLETKVVQMLSSQLLIPSMSR
jgi:hypothetical protein